MGTPEGLLYTDNASCRVENGSRKALRDMFWKAEPCKGNKRHERRKGGQTARGSGGGQEA